MTVIISPISKVSEEFNSLTDGVYGILEFDFGEFVSIGHIVWLYPIDDINSIHEGLFQLHVKLVPCSEFQQIQFFQGNLLLYRQGDGLEWTSKGETGKKN